MIKDIQSFIGYFEGIRRRTLNYLKTIPPDRLDWSPKEGEFTPRQIALHIGSTEQMFVSVFVNDTWKFHDDHGDHQADTLDQLLAHLEQTHIEAMTALKGMDNSVLNQQRTTLEKTTLSAWRLLMMMTEHEIHHRSQLAVNLALMGVEPPQVFGMYIEDVIARITG